jgi:hypothetical protein
MDDLQVGTVNRDLQATFPTPSFLKELI